MDELFVKQKLQHSISINPEDINNKIDDILYQKLAEEIEGKCIKDGYVKTGSVQIVDRSLGEILVGHFTGDILYNLIYTVDLCNPLEGSVINAKVVNINKMGVLANAGEGIPPPLHILLAKQHHIDNETFEGLEEGMDISVKILGKRFEYGDNQISIIGTLESLAAKKKKRIIKKKKAPTEGTTDEDAVEDCGEPLYFDNTNPDTLFLSSYNKANQFQFNGRTYETVQHAYQAQKLDGDDEQSNSYRDLLTADTESYIGDRPDMARDMGSKKSFDKLKLVIRKDWHQVREILLKQILTIYFNVNEDLKAQLVETGERPLIMKGKNINDHWGVVGKKEEGQNIYGKMLMELRDEFKL